MKEYGIINNITEKENIIYGYDMKDAFKRAKLDIAEWSVTYQEYID